MEIRTQNYPRPDIAMVDLIGQFWRREDANLLEARVNTQLPSCVAVVLNTERVTFISSVGLGSLAHLYKKCAECEKGFLLYKPVGNVKETLELSGLPSMIRIAADAAELEQELSQH
ncbi:MAG: STAS domain-containing protein [Chitinivibrionales bacterium]|nr:STAS domain-containing protein [Chitinivibrionales bacterium]